MNIFSKLFGKKEEIIVTEPLTVDFHSHLLPGIDDGVKNFEESLEIIRAFKDLGYKKLITTPHIMSDNYQNTPEIILPLLDQLRELLVKNNIDIEVDAAAEYFMDSNLSQLAKEKKLLTFGDNYVLVETSFLNPNDYFQNIMFDLKINGYQPILAHPERYLYMYEDMDMYRELKAKETLFQINLSSLAGYYSKESKKIAETLIKENMVEFVGSDVHHMRHIASITEALQTVSLKTLLANGVRNNAL